MDKQTFDRRSQRSRQSLSDALVSLMVEKRYDKITVQDIIDRANVGRSTFYAHFRDKEDLLVSGVMAVFTQHLLDHKTGNHEFIAVSDLFRHVEENQHLYEALAWGRGVELLYRQAEANLSQRMAEQLQSMLPEGQSLTVPLPVLATYVASTLVTLLRWWLEHNLPYSPGEMDSMFHQLVMPTIEAVVQSAR
ncbi:MAG: TetR/AcrR family transcriptional regulator [Anaerolineaceae bacterium]|nr:TetR/AcrR family transcriptional regulator [Anaerolineaceae bacterium]